MRDPELVLGRRCASALAALALDDGQGPLLTYEYARPRRHVDDVAWFRFSAPDREAEPLPPRPGVRRFDAAVVRIDKSREATTLALVETSACVRIGGRLFMYGGNDEGIRAWDGRDGFQTVDAGGHGRVLLREVQDEASPEHAGHDHRHLVPWRRLRRSRPGLSERDWIEYPGCFSIGGDDPGSALLAKTLDSHPPPKGKTLDFGCGPGFLCAALRERGLRSPIVALDHDALALVALRENVPDVEAVLGSTPADALRHGLGGFSFIMSNPPLHDGRVRTRAMWHALVETAPSLLAPEGELRFVVQRQVKAERLLSQTFKRFSALLTTSRYIVWSATK